MGTESALWHNGKAAGGLWLGIEWFTLNRLDQLPSADLRATRDLHVTELSMMSVNMVTADVSELIPEPGAKAGYTLWDQRQSKARLWALAAATLIFGLAYYPNFLELIAKWKEDPNYSHGFLVIPIAVWILWQRLAARNRNRRLAQSCDHGGAGSSWRQS